ncbi:MAG: lipid A biosynthesis acyltransferase [Arachidicoccus sp.]|nr:lipid A biosynthesis acyltransferase [Arachidicoccus sp.]
MYYILYGFLYLISLLPFFILYAFSDAIAFILYGIIRYRRKVVSENLKIAFPEKSNKERNKISKEFYRRFTDNFIETIKLISLPQKSVSARFDCDYKTLESLYNQGFSCDIIMAHSFNWEWANLAYSISNPFTQLIVYAHVNNKTMEKIMLKIRSRFGTKLIDTYKFKEQFKPYIHQQKSFVLVADQSPRFLRGAYWLDFFGKRTAFTKGPETSARIADNAVVFCEIIKIKRGFYRSQLTVHTTHARQTERGEITKASVRFFEETIRKDPANYLWSHRRWKRQFDESRDTKNVIG